MADAITYTVYEVRSDLTGAVVGTHDKKRTAEREAARLNVEAKNPIGVTPDGETIYVGSHQGRLTTYSVSDPLVRVDALATARARLEELKAVKLDELDDDQRAGHEREVEQTKANIDAGRELWLTP